MKEEAMDDGLGRVWQIAQGSPNVNARSKCYKWMMRNYDAFLARLETDFPGWPGIALGLAEIGILGRGKRRLTGEQVRKTWWRVRFEHAKMEKLGVDGSAAVVTPAPKAPPFRKSRRRKENPIIPKKDPPARRVRPAPSLIIPDPPVMPPDVRMVSTEPAVGPAGKVKEALRMLAQENSWLPRHPGRGEAAPSEPAASTSEDDAIKAALRRGREWIS